MRLIIKNPVKGSEFIPPPAPVVDLGEWYEREYVPEAYDPELEPDIRGRSEDILIQPGEYEIEQVPNPLGLSLDWARLYFEQTIPLDATAREIALEAFPERRYHDDEAINARIAKRVKHTRDRLIKQIVAALTRAYKEGESSGDAAATTRFLEQQRQQERKRDMPPWHRPRRPGKYGQENSP